MDNPKIMEYLKSKKIGVYKFAEMIGYDKKHVSWALRKKRRASRRLVRAIIEATEGAVDESDFILTRYDV